MIELLEIQNRVRSAKGATVQMVIQSEAPVVAAPAEKELAQRLVVPVDASSASIHAVDLAIRLAQLRRTEVLLVALLPDPKPDEIDPEVFSALWMQSEMGMGVPVVVAEPDEEARVQSRYETVLQPLERRVAAAGVAVETQLLHGAGLPGQFRRLLYEGDGRSGVVLSNPLKLYGPLRGLTNDLWAEPQCTTYVAGVDSTPLRPGAVVRGLLQRIFGGRNATRTVSKHTVKEVSPWQP